MGLVAYPIELDSTGGSFSPRRATVQKQLNSIVVGEEATIFNPSAIGNEQSLAQSALEYALTVYYFSRKGATNILTSELAQVMRDVENYIVGQAAYDDLCWKPNNVSCAPPRSLRRILFAAANPGCGTYAPSSITTTL